MGQIKNDWIVAGINNPDFTTSDFVTIAELNTDNTQLLSPEEYLKYDFITSNEAFQDDNKQFSQDKFLEHYNKRLYAFNELRIEEAPMYDMFDIQRKAGSKTIDVQYTLRKGYNPDRRKIGISGINEVSDPEWSRRELAKRERVYNHETGEFEGYSVNDVTLFESPIEWIKQRFRDPLILASWDEDGKHINPITGEEEEHKKGDLKVNNNGTYYYETLGGRSAIGKDILSTFDTFSVDGKGINKYDFFDSNDIEKSTAGIIAKNVAAILPMFIPYVGTAYAATQVVNGLSQAAPMLYGMASSLLGWEDSPLVNTIGATASSWKTSTSDYSIENSVTFENFASLVTDVALQWGQQKAIAQAFNSMKKTSSILDEAQDQARAYYEIKKAALGESEELWQAALNKFMPAAQKKLEAAQAVGRNVSLGYMAITSNTDVYNNMIERGATKGEAATVALGSTVGMFLFDKYSNLGELFFDDATGDVVKASRKAIKEEFEKAGKAFEIISKSDASSKNKAVQLFAKAAQISKRAISKFSEDLKYHTTSTLQKMVGEGLEEVGEEFMADLSKGIYEMANTLGIYKGTISDAGAFEDPLSRYGQSFFGGAVGGALFHGVEVFNGTNAKKKDYADFATLIRNGHADDLRQEVVKLAKRGHAGSKTLSATAFEKTDDGTIVWRTADSYDNSQEKAVIDMVNDKITTIQEVLENNRVNLNDDQLFENMVLSERRFKRYKEISGITNYYDDFSNVLAELVQTEMELKDASDTLTGLPRGTAIPSDRSLGSLTPEQLQERAENLDRLKAKRDEAKAKLEEFMSGDTSLDYTRKLHFAMDPMLHAPFLALSQDEYFKSLYPGKSVDDLSQEEMIAFVTQYWPDYVRTQLKANLNTAWQEYKSIEAKIAPALGTVDLSNVDSKTYLGNLNILYEKLDSLSPESLINYNTQLEGESDDDYKNRNIPLDGESEEEYEKRRWERYKKVREANQKLIEEWAGNIHDFIRDNNIHVDPVIRRRIKQSLLSNQRADDLRKEAMLFAFSNLEFGGINTIRNEILDLVLSAKSAEDFDKIEGKIFEIRKRDLSRTGFDRDSVATALSSKIIGKIKTVLNQANGFETIKSIAKIVRKLEEDADDDGNEFTISLLDEAYNEWLNVTEEEYNDIREFISLLEEGDYGNVLGVRDSYFKELTFGQLSSLLGLDKIIDIDGQDTGIQQSDYENGLNKEIKEELLTGVYSSLLKESKAGVIVRKIKKAFLDTLNEIGSMPVSKLQLDDISGDPVLEGILRNLAGEDALVEINKVLDAIQNDYDNISDVTQLILNDAQIGALEKGKKALEILRAVLYSASTKVDPNLPVGHNKTINDFAEHNKDKLRKEWNKLVEIEDGIATMYAKTIDDLIEEADRWVAFSNNNNINKLAKIRALGKDFNTSLFDYLNSLPRAVRVDIDKEKKVLDILAGIDSIDTLNMEEKHASILYQVERLIYKNIQQFAADNNMSVEELINNTDILEQLVPGIKSIGGQASTPPFANMTSNDITPFDRLQYLAMIIAEDPAIYTQELASRVAANPQVVPIVGQEFAARLAVVSMSDTFKSVLKKGRGYSNLKRSTLENTTIIFGVAGAGKTQVVLNAVDSRLKDAEVFIAGPTIHQASNMGRAMSRSNPMTFQELFHRIIGKSQYEDIKNANPTNNDYYTLSNSSDGGTIVELNESSITFSNVSPMPKAIYIDEATHLSTIESLLLDAYAKRVGAQVFLVGDEGQNGYKKAVMVGKSAEYIIENIGALNVFAARTPTLTLSLRDANLQKFINLENVRSILSTFIHSLNHDSVEDYNKLFNTLESAIRNLNFRVYYEDDINGDLITPDIDEKTLGLLKRAQNGGKSIAFIGDNSSPMLAKLRSAGISIGDGNILDTTSMQGQEYDYVVIDQEFKDISNSSLANFFLKNLYTLMSRAREGSIFIDNGLSKIIGQNMPSPYKTPAPSILLAAEGLSRDRIASLQELDYTPIEILGKVERKTTDNTIFDDLEEELLSEEEEEVIREIEEDSETNPNFNDALVDENIENILRGEEPNGDSALSKFPIQAYSDLTLIGAERKTVTTINIDEQGNTISTEEEAWVINNPKEESAPLRNLQGLVEERERGEEITSYIEKIELQKRLQSVKSVLQYGSNYANLPSYVKNKIVSEENWKKGRHLIEFREVNDSLDSLPIGSNFKSVGIERSVNGKTKKIIANLIFEFKNNAGKIVRIDLAGLNNPETLVQNKDSIKKRFEQIINKTTDKDVKDRLTTYLANIDPASKSYSDWFYEQVEKMGKVEEGETHTIDATGAVNKSKYLWLAKRKGQGDNPRLIRLGGEYDPQKGRRFNRNSLRARNPHLTFSPVYAFANEGDGSIIDKSFKGKTVVFVTEDPSLKGRDLAELYFNQKKNPDKNKAKVRAIMLSNEGISFKDLSTYNFFDTYKDTKGNISRPVKQKHIGINMFTSLWNARASILQFNEVLKEWKEEKGLDSKSVEAITKLEYLKYLEGKGKFLHDNPDTHKKENDNALAISGFSDIDEALATLTNLNEKFKDVPMFRLGYSSTQNNPYFVRSFDISGSQAYKDGNVNLVAITEKGASDMLEMLNFTLSYIAPYKETILNKGQSNTANLSISKIGGDGGLIEIQENQLIDLKNEGHKRTLSGLLSFKDGGISIEDENGNKIAFLDGDAWSAIPQILGKLARNSQEIASANGIHGTQRSITYLFKTGTGNDMSNEKRTLFIDFSSIYNDILEENNHALSNMFNLIFHGTTDNFRNSVTPKHAEAIFTNGIYISPLIEYSEDKAYTYEGVKLYPIKTNEAFMLSDVDVRSSGFTINIQTIIDNENNIAESTSTDSSSKPANSQNKTEKTFLEKELENDRIRNIYETLATIDSNVYNKSKVEEAKQYDEDKAKEFHEKAIQTYKDALNNEVLGYIETKMKTKDNLNYILKKGFRMSDDYQVYTLENFLEVEGYSDFKYVNDGVFSATRDGKRYEITVEDGKLKTTEVPTVDPNAELKEKLKIFLDNIVEVSSLDTIPESVVNELKNIVEISIQDPTTDNIDSIKEKLNDLFSIYQEFIENLQEKDQDTYDYINERC